MRDVLPKITIRPDISVEEAVHVLNRGDHQIVLVADPETQRLLGVVTDYDVRQVILRHLDMSRPISEIMHVNPIVGPADVSDADAQEILRTRRVSQLPLLDEAGRVVDIVFDDTYVHLSVLTAKSVAVVMAGGLGSRLHPMTETIPKPLLHVGGRPILFSLLDQLLFEGFGRIYVTINYKSDMIVDAVSQQPDYRERIHFISEAKALGTAGSLSLLPERPKHSFAVLNADLLTNLSLKSMLRHHERDQNAVTVAIKRETNVIPYGVAELDGARIIAIREKPNYSYFINTGVYVVEPETLDVIPPDTFMDMPDVVTRMIECGRQVGSFPVHEYWLDIGNYEHYARAQEDYRQVFASEVRK